jgi:hypothetical protein
MPRKDRADILIGNLEKKLGLARGAIRNPDGTDARSDKKLGTLREEYRSLYGSLPVRKNASIIAAAVRPKANAVSKKSPAKAAAKSTTTGTAKKATTGSVKKATPIAKAKPATTKKPVAAKPSSGTVKRKK